jgi:hypothetical protein
LDTAAQLGYISAGSHLKDEQDAAKYEQAVNKATAYMAQQANKPNC